MKSVRIQETMKPFFFAAALKDELAALLPQLMIEKTYHREQAHFFQGHLGGHPVILGYTGIGEAATRQGLTVLLNLVDVAAVIGIGCVGGLTPDLENGALILADEICRAGDKGGRWKVATELQDLCRAALSREPVPLHEGRIVTVEQALTTPQAKAEAAEQYGAIAVDMESAALAEIAAEYSKSFIVLRSVLDPLRDTVPAPENFLDRSHRVAKRRVLAYIAHNPQRVWDLPRLASQSSQVRRKLGQVVPILVASL